MGLLQAPSLSFRSYIIYALLTSIHHPLKVTSKMNASSLLCPG